MDPYRWQTKFAESLKRLSHITQGRDGYKEAIHHLENVFMDRLMEQRTYKYSGRVITYLLIQDITAVMRIYAQQEETKKQAAKDEQHTVDDAPPLTLPFHSKPGSSAEKEDGNPEDYKQLQHNLVLRQAPRGEDEPKASSSEEEGDEAGDDKLVLQRDLVLRQAPCQEDKDTLEG
jgi:hypothetical protein